MIYFMFSKKHHIFDIEAYEILSSGSFPTIEVRITLGNGQSACASVPFGASAGRSESVTLLDKDKKRFQGRGMLKAVKNIEEKIAAVLKGRDIFDQRRLDELMIQLDATKNKSNLGGNSLLAVSLACCRLGSLAADQSLWHYIEDCFDLPPPRTLPQPMMVVIEGGLHADNSTDFQEYLLAPANTKSSPTLNIRKISEIYHELRAILKKYGYNTNVGNEGAYAPAGITTNEEPFSLLLEAIKKAGYIPGQDIGLAIDPASSEFYKDKIYQLTRDQKRLSGVQLIDYYQNCLEKYPLFSIEDGLAENDWAHWKQMYQRLGKKVLIIGDDLTTTHHHLVEKAVKNNTISGVIIKPNQVGTLSETIQTIQTCQKNKLDTIVSHRGGGETNDTFIIDLAVAAGSKYVKVGPSRGERVEKYNRLMGIERSEW